MPELIST